MTFELLMGVLDLVWAFANFSLWRKHKERHRLWFAWFGVAPFVMFSIDFALRHIPQAPSMILFLDSWVLLGLAVIGAALFNLRWL